MPGIRQSRFARYDVSWFLALCVLTLAAIGCGPSQREVNRAAEEVYDAFYIPADAVFLGRVKDDHLLAYARGCKGTVIMAVYGINRPIAEVVAEYEERLTNSGWELDPGYRQMGNDRAFFWREPMESLYVGDEIHSILFEELSEKAFQTFYTVSITYSLPSNADCIG